MHLCALQANQKHSVDFLVLEAVSADCGLLDGATNPFHVPNASLAQAYYLGPAMDPREQTSLRTAATQFHHGGHVVSPGMLGIDGRSYGIQEGPTVMVKFNLFCM